MIQEDSRYHTSACTLTYVCPWTCKHGQNSVYVVSLNTSNDKQWGKEGIITSLENPVPELAHWGSWIPNMLGQAYFKLSGLLL